MRGPHTLTIAMRAEGKARARWGNGRTYTPEATQASERRIEAEWMAARLPRLIEGPLRMYVRAEYAPPASWSAKKRAEAIGKPYDQKPDCDNVFKLCADALNGIAFPDDRRIADAGICQVYGEADRLTITIAQMALPQPQTGDGW